MTGKSPPETNFSGLREHWRSDLIAGFSVALVALPLAIGIATAAGVPPISGLVSAFVAGTLTTFLRGSKVAINGPGNSLIVIVASGLALLGGPEAFPHVLGAVVIAGGIQILFGALRLGKLGDVLPAAVVQGMLAAIGLIIVGKQAHVVFGRASSASSAIATFQELPETILHLHPTATLIGILSVVILVAHPHIKAKLVHLIPAPLWVVIVTVPLDYILTHFDPQISAAIGRSLYLDESLFVSIPDDIAASLMHPSFDRIGEPSFWMVVITIAVVTSMENIVSVKAVDKLDSYRRQSNLNRDLAAVGLSTVISGFLGGLPVLTVVARSSVNVNHGAKTGWSNFFHGALLFAFVLFLAPVIEEVSLAALAGILVYTGYKLAGPHVVKDALRRGPDHFLVFGITLIATLMWGLLWGIGVGLLAELVGHMLILGLPPREALGHIRETRVETVHEEDGPYLLRVHGVANYLNLPRLRRALDAVPEGEAVILDFSTTELVDGTLLEYCHERARRYERDHAGARFEILGLEGHRALSDRPDTLHAKDRSELARRLTPRQKVIAERAEEKGWSFDARRDWEPSELGEFHFFRLHPIEYRDTTVTGRYEVEGGEIEVSVSDVTFDEGVLIMEVYSTTALVIRLPVELPELTLDKEELLDRAFNLTGYSNMDLEEVTELSKGFVIRGTNKTAICSLVSPEVLAFLKSEESYHLECSGHRMVIFKNFMRVATPDEIERMLDFGQRLSDLLLKNTGEESGEHSRAARAVEKFRNSG